MAASWWTCLLPFSLLFSPSFAPAPPPPTGRLANMTYWVSFPSQFRLGEPLGVSVYVSDSTGPFTLRLDLMDYYGNLMQDGQNFTLADTAKVQSVDFKIAKTLRSGSHSKFIRAQAFGGKEFDGFQRVTEHHKRLSLFVQTDKKTYKPGQTVKFRALSMQPDLKVTHQPMDVVITDPSNNRIAHWLHMNSSDDTGVVQGEMVTSSYPPLGSWTIKATVDDVSEEQHFRIEEYELPQFEVNIKLPKYGLVTDKKVPATVTAMYTFGSPIEGSGTLVVKYQYYRSSPYSLVKEFKLDKKGQAQVEFTPEELLDIAFNATYHRFFARYSSGYLASRRRSFSLHYKSFTFNATVTDDLTDDVMSAQKSLRFYDRAVYLRFMPITPSAYKPGLPLSVYVEALQPNYKDPVENPEDYTIYFEIYYYRPWSESLDGEYTTRYPWQRPPSQKQVLMTKQVPLDKNGVATWNIECLSIPDDANGVTIVAKHGASRTTKYLQKFVSLSNTFLQLQLKTKLPRVHKKVKFTALSNKDFGNFTYQVFAKGTLLVSKRVTEATRSKRNSFKLSVTNAMYPVADVVAFFEADNGEVVADRMVIAVDGELPNELSLEFKKSEVKPGKRAKLKVSASPRTTVFLLGVDKSVKLLGTGNDITREEVMSELVQYGSGGTFFNRGSIYYNVYAWRAGDIFRGANVGIITDGKIPGEYYWDIPISFRPTTTPPPRPTGPPMPAPTLPGTVAPPPPPATGGPLPPAPPPPTAAPGPPPGPPGGTTTTTAPPPTGAPEALQPAERLRQLFPETWLWDSVTLKDKSETVKLKTPDTITTWVVTAFAVHPDLGLSVATQPAELLTIKRLFVTLDLPYSAVRGEDVCITAVTFNRYNGPVKATITLAQNATAFDNTLVRRTESAGNLSNKVEVVRKPVKVENDLGLLEADSKTSTVFCINPSSLGEMPVQVFLKADRPADGLVQTIRIKPEGVERTQSYPVVIEIEEGKDFTSTVDIDVPKGFVEGSLRITFQVVGDVMGVVAANMEDLLRMPYGCGEQNMVNFAPNTYLISYLRDTSRLTPDILKKAQLYMVSGYQRQLNYRRQDHSFSAFGDRDRSGSTWLTAFVVKCFVQAAALGDVVITIDPEVVNRAVHWMTLQQNTNGSFREPGRVIHRAMQGGSAAGPGLAAYVTIALQEAKNSFSDHMTPSTRARVDSALTRAVSYLESHLNSVKSDTYTVCIVAYALTLTGSAKAAEAREKMEKLASSKGNLKFWSGTVEVKQKYYSWYRKTDALSIEMTSYAMMTLMQKGSLSDALPVFRWLNNQRGPNGGFISTQDTVVGLEALSTMAGLALGDDFAPINVQVMWNCVAGSDRKASLTIDKDSVLLLQKLELPLENNEYPRHVTIKAKSASKERLFTLGEVVVNYNVDSSTIEQTFSATTTVSNNTAKSFVLTTCVRRNSDNNTDSMVIAEVGVPSGFQVDRQRSDLGSASRVEFPEAERHVVFYYAALDSKGECSVLTMRMTKGVVAHTKPSPVRVYDYYNPDEEVTTMYSLKQFGVCDLEPHYMDCPHAK